MKNIFSIVLCFLLAVCSTAQQVEWEKDYGWSSGDVIYGITKNGNSYYSTGLSSFNTGTDRFLFLVKTNSNGDTVFIKKTSLEPTWTVDIEITKEHNLLLLSAKWSDSAFSYDRTLISKWDTLGNILWKKEYNIGNYDELSIISLTDESAIFVGKTSTSGLNYYAVHIDSSGNEIWNKTFLRGGLQIPSNLIQLSDGSYLMSGYNHIGLDRSIYYLKFDEDGNELASGTLVNPISDTTFTNGYITATMDGGYLATGYSIEHDWTHIIRYDSAFTPIWDYVRPYDSFGIPYELTNGNIFVTGMWDATKSAFAMILNSSGTLIIDSILLPQFDPSLNSEIHDVAFDGEGGVVLAGSVDYFGTPARDDFYFVKLDNVGIPVTAQYGCNAPLIHWATVEVVGQSFIQLADSASEHIEYSSILVHDWYFMDGGHVQGQFNSYSFDNIAYPDSFWCQLVVTDGVGCTDTMTIDAYTGEIIYPNPTYEPPLGTKETLRSAQRDVRVYPNPFTDQFVVQLSASLQRPHIQVMDMLGKQMNVEYQIANNSVIINGSSLPKGMYILHIQGYGQTKIVKR